MGEIMAKKYYAVRDGRKVGIFNSWAECQKQVQGYSNAEYKSFKKKADALNYLNQGEPDLTVYSIDPKAVVVAYVDGSFSLELNQYSYGVVMIIEEEVIEKLKGVGKSPEMAEMRNVSGELLGAMKAIKWAYLNKYKKVIIHHDYTGIAKWANGVWKRNKEGTQQYKAFIDKYRKKLAIEFVKVPAHAGIEYNEMADELAKEALEEIK